MKQKKDTAFQKRIKPTFLKKNGNRFTNKFRGKFRFKKFVKKAFLKKKNLSLIYYVCISLTPNNCFATLTTRKGRVLLSYSGGNAGFKGPRRSSPTCAFRVGCDVSAKLKTLKSKSKKPFEVYIVLKSPINKRVRNLINGLMHYFDLYSGVINKFVKAHNGVRAPNVRRV